MPIGTQDASEKLGEASEKEGCLDLCGLEEDQRGADGGGVLRCRLQVQPLIHQELASHPGVRRPQPHQ